MATYDELDRYFVNEFHDVVFEILYAREFLNEIGDDVVSRIRTRSQRGFGVPRSGGRQRRFVPLSEDYVEFRRQARRDGVLSGMTTPRRSNITFTGNLLESITYTLQRRGGGADERQNLLFGFSNTRAELTAAELHGARRPFFFLTRGDINRITRLFDARVRRDLVQSFEESLR